MEFAFGLLVGFGISMLIRHVDVKEQEYTMTASGNSRGR